VAEVFEDPAECVRGADLVIVTTPVDTAEETFLAIAPGLAPGAVVTDAGSVKGAILVAARRLPAANPFVGAHPMAGGEKAGAAHASAQLFEGRVCFLTPTGSEDPRALTAVRRFWQELGSVLHETDAAQHDEIVAAISHVPHAAASALMLAVMEQPGFRRFAVGAGLRDTTRIAAGEENLWVGIMLANARHTASGLRDLERRAAELRAAIEANDAGSLRRPRRSAASPARTSTGPNEPDPRHPSLPDPRPRRRPGPGLEEHHQPRPDPGRARRWRHAVHRRAVQPRHPHPHRRAARAGLRSRRRRSRVHDPDRRPRRTHPARPRQLHVGNAGTAARFLTAFLALAPQGEYELDGDEAMRARPMRGLLDALRAGGCRADAPDGTPANGFPVHAPHDGQAGRLEVDASASSQLLSALLMVLPLSAGASVNMKGSTVSEPFVEMTARMCGQFGRPLSRLADGSWTCGSPGA
jgi:prephenate dehydrogenase